MKEPRRFSLNRDRDHSGVSGTGVVAYGVMFGDGSVVMRWHTPDMPHSTNVYESITAVKRIHGHGGSTRIVWIDSGGNP